VIEKNPKTGNNVINGIHPAVLMGELDGVKDER